MLPAILTSNRKRRPTSKISNALTVITPVHRDLQAIHYYYVTFGDYIAALQIIRYYHAGFVVFQYTCASRDAVCIYLQILKGSSAMVLSCRLSSWACVWSSVVLIWPCISLVCG